ncbi:MAG: Fur family ferric uptake [Beijerinckiaceae bacterium]|nr:MAG: Fur family ferric uptake [Beijerinckiaceae bacterium]
MAITLQDKPTGEEIDIPIVGPAIRPAHERGESATKLRQKVLETLCGSAIPLSAYDILSQIQGEKRIAPTQVYRALDSLQEAGAIYKLASRPAFVLRASAPDTGRSVVFMVCRECDRVQESAVSSSVQHLQVTAAKAGFRASNPIVEIVGECADCGSEGRTI